MPNWTKEQEKAIYEPSGKKNILVSAAAGSGKTAVLVERIVNLITNSENPFPIDSILVATFTEAAATEMKERIIKEVGKEGYDIQISTFHSFGLRIIRKSFFQSRSNNLHQLFIRFIRQQRTFGLCYL